MATLSAATLAIVYWLTMLVGAGLSCLLAVCKFVDWKRQKKCPSRHEYASSQYAADTIRTLPRRYAALFSKSETEPVAKLWHVLHLMQTGDVLHFSGRKLHSYINRIIRWTRMSHSAMVYVDAAKRVWVAEVVEKFKIERAGWWFRINFGGFQLVPIEDYVTKHPGQLYWGRVSDVYGEPTYNAAGDWIPPKFNRDLAKLAIEGSRHWGYGWACIGLQILMAIPFVKEIHYLRTWRDIGKSWGPTHSPDCSCAVSRWAEGAYQDPVPQLASQLTTPAEIERSKLWDEPVALAA